MRPMHKSHLIAALACAAMLACSRGASAEGGQPLERKAVDTSVYNTLRDIINQGADIYNSGGWAECYRLYEGALTALRPLLDHRPNLQKAIDDGLRKARANAAVHQRAFDLREVIDRVRADVNPNPVAVKPSPPSAKTLWDRLGTEAGVKAVIDDFLARASKDPKVDATRGGKFLQKQEDKDKLKKQLLDLVSDASGGPYKYKGKTMKEAHKGMKITDEQFNAAAGHLEAALKAAKVADADVKAVLGVVEETRKDIVEPTEPPPPAKTLWQRLGGEENVKKVIDDFVLAAAKDPKVDFTRGGKYPINEDKEKALKKSLLDQISDVSGGPHKYKGKSMKEVHKGMGITDAQFDALAGHLKDALEKNKAAADDVKAVMAVVGATRKDIVEGKSPSDDKDKKPTDKPTTDKPATDK